MQTNEIGLKRLNYRWCVDRLKYLGYVRVSTDDQVDGFSIDFQIKSISNYAEMHTLELEMIHVDDGYSGHSLDRPEIQKIIEKLKTPNTYAGIIVYKLDRISRNLKDILIIHDDILKAVDASLISIVEKFDTSTPTGKLMFQIIGGFAEFERETIRERTTSGRIEKAKQGRYAGGRVCFGYDILNSEYVVNDDEAPIVREAFYLREELRYGLKRIAKALNEKGYRTKGGRFWTHIHVKNLLERERFYRGEIYKYGTVQARATQEAILISDL